MYHSKQEKISKSTVGAGTAILADDQIDDAEDETLLHNNLQEVITAATRAKDLVKQIPAFSRQADKELKPVQVDLIE